MDHIISILINDALTMTNNSTKSYVAFFDVDHTILNVNSGRILAHFAHQNKILSTRNLLTGLAYGSCYKMGIMHPEKIITHMMSWFKGITEDELKEMSSKIFDRYLRGSIRENIREEINFHKGQNAKTVILSAAISYICIPIMENLNFDELICTDLEVEDGIFTGRASGNYCYGDEKSRRAEQYCQINGCHIDQAYFYSDSMADYPFLLNVGHPVCVSPEPRLKRIAQQKGWRILSDGT